MILPCEIPQLDIPDVGRNHIPIFFFVPGRKIISVKEIYSDSLFDLWEGFYGTLYTPDHFIISLLLLSLLCDDPWKNLR